jgi:NAD(P)-dependent dehydrogenase (short-subunit alcohol dehydrogenase family)
VVLITGASRGIGRDAALLAAERGYTVAINYVSNRAKAEDVESAIRAAGGKAALFHADVSKVAEVERMFAEIDAQLGGIDALVNNAGVGLTQGRLDQTKPEQLVATFEVNVFGSFYCSQAAMHQTTSAMNGRSSWCGVMSLKLAIAVSSLHAVRHRD